MWSLTLTLPDLVLYAYPISQVCLICSTHFKRLDLIALTMQGVRFIKILIMCSSLFCCYFISYVQHPVL
jgi:hypothetical protein